MAEKLESAIGYDQSRYEEEFYEEKFSRGHCCNFADDSLDRSAYIDLRAFAQR